MSDIPTDDGGNNEPKDKIEEKDYVYIDEDTLLENWKRIVHLKGDEKAIQKYLKDANLIK